MPFIPHTKQDTQAMLQQIGVKSIEDLFDEIPQTLMIDSLKDVPEGLSEMELMRLMNERAEQTEQLQCFIGAGAYEHHIPAAVWDITQRGEFLTAYTPYQAEASQGSLQLMWEYQTMMASMMGMDISNASLYEGASALCEAILMAIRSMPKEQNPTVWIGSTIHPFYRQVLQTILGSSGVRIQEIAHDSTGIITVDALEKKWQQNPHCTVMVLGQPNFFGRLENVDELTDWSHEKGALVVGVVNPIAMAWLKPPGEWGNKGADIACGEGQPLGVPLAGGGPYFGFLCSKLALVRQMPGRLVGLTKDKDNQEGYTLTLQAREQHIRRGKATSNICTNQGLLVTAATIYMSLLGPTGLEQVAQKCYSNHQYLSQLLTAQKIAEPVFTGDHFHESVWRFKADVNLILENLRQLGFAGGFNLSPWYPSLENSLLMCVTETKNDKDIEQFVEALKKAVARSNS
ncbi:MAG: aminomethyl-transferring glycine dehydrogenase subunit GcvPA [Candidatus Berkiella sp.]